MHRALRPANGLHLTGAWHTLQFGLDRVRHTLQIDRRQCLLAPQRHCQHRHIVNAFGFDNRRECAQITRQPVLIRIQHVIQPHQRLGARHTDLELHRHHGQAGPRHRVGVLNARNLAQHLFRRARHHVLHIDTAGPRKRDQHIGHGHIDLWLFFTRGHQYCEDAQQQRHQGQQWRDGVELEGLRQPP